MKRIWLLLVLCLCARAQGQNLVPNGSFEQSIGCPNNITGCTSWAPYGTLYSAYMKSCGTPGTSGVPSNTFGYQVAADGYSYASLYTYTKSQPDAKEYITAVLKQPMQIGTTYEVSMSVSLSDNSAFAGDDLAIHLFKTGPVYYNQYTVLSHITPTISFISQGTIKEKQKWVRKFKVYTADSAYDHIAIGGFSPYNTMGLDSVSPGNYAVYYVDSVMIRQVRMQVVFSDTAHCAGDSITVGYNTFTNNGFQPGNIFSLVLSDATGNFGAGTVLGTATANAGTMRVRIPITMPTGNYYRLKLVSSLPVDSSADNGTDMRIYAPPDANVYMNPKICEGDTLFLLAYGNKPVDPVGGYKWYGYGMNGVAVNPQRVPNVSLAYTGNYYLLASFHGCTTIANFSITIAPSPQNVKATNSGPACTGETLYLFGNSSTNGLTYEWLGKNGFKSVHKDTLIQNLSVADTGMYYFKATLNGCTIGDSTYLGVKLLPTPNIMVNSPLCAGDSLKLQCSESFTGETYEWTGPDNFTAGVRTPSIVGAPLSASGKYIVKVNANGCTGRDTADVVVKRSPAKPDAYSNSPVCEGDTLNFYTIAPVNGVRYEWSSKSFIIEDTAIQLVLPVPSVSGIYVLTADSNGCYSSDSINAVVKPLPNIPSLESNSPLQTPQHLEIQITNIQAGVKYLWSGPNGYQSQLPNPSIYSPAPNYSGTYKVIANLDGCISTADIYVRIDQSVDTGNIQLFPSFNDGSFKLRGLLRKDQQIQFRIFDAGGKEVHSGYTQTNSKMLSADFDLKNYLASGCYLLHLIADDKKQTFRFVVQR